MKTPFLQMLENARVPLKPGPANSQAEPACLKPDPKGPRTQTIGF